MRSHQQRVPIISPLDRDYRRSSYTSDDLNFSSSSLASLSSFGEASARSENAYSTSDNSLDTGSSTAGESMDLRFTILGERDIS